MVGRRTWVAIAIANVALVAALGAALGLRQGDRSKVPAVEASAVTQATVTGGPLTPTLGAPDGNRVEASSLSKGSQTILWRWQAPLSSPSPAA